MNEEPEDGDVVSRELPSPLIVPERSTPRKPKAPEVKPHVSKPADVPIVTGPTAEQLDRLWVKYRERARACGSWEPDDRRPDWRPE